MRLLPYITILAAAVLFSACESDDKDTKPAVNPTIVFVSDSGYVFRDDTAAFNESLRVGVVIERGTDAMHHFKVTVSYDGGVPQVTDSIPMGTDSFEFEKVMITRAQAGTEKWSFNVVENDGDAIRRSLLITVQE